MEGSSTLLPLTLQPLCLQACSSLSFQAVGDSELQSSMKGMTGFVKGHPLHTLRPGLQRSSSAGPSWRGEAAVPYWEGWLLLSPVLAFGAARWCGWGGVIPPASFPTCEAGVRGSPQSSVPSQAALALDIHPSSQKGFSGAMLYLN